MQRPNDFPEKQESSRRRLRLPAPPGMPLPRKRRAPSGQDAENSRRLPDQRLLKHWISPSCLLASAIVPNVPRFRRRPERGFTGKRLATASLSLSNRAGGFPAHGLPRVYAERAFAPPGYRIVPCKWGKPRRQASSVESCLPALWLRRRIRRLRRSQTWCSTFAKCREALPVRK